jgi:hypothetical protein
MPGPWLAFLIAVGPAQLAAAPPLLTHLFPAGAQRDKSVLVSVGNSIDGPSVSAWCSRDDVRVRILKKSSKLEVHALPNAAPGVCWIRLYNAEGSSEVRPFLIGLHPEIVEIEPNERLSQAQKIETETVVVNGVLSKVDDVDTFNVRLKAGQTLVAAMTANPTLGSPMDGVLQIVSSDGFVLAQNDDDQKFDPRIVFTAPSDGTYFVRTFAFPAQPNQSIRFYHSSEAIYRLTLSTGSFIDHTWPLAITAGNQRTIGLRGWNLGKGFERFAVDGRREPGQFEVFDPKLANSATCRIVSHATAVEAHVDKSQRKLEIPVSISGTIERPNEIDEYVVAATKGDTLVFEVESRSLGFPLDPVLEILGPGGAVLADVDDAAAGNEDPTFTHRVEATGDYRVRIFDRFGHAGERFVYLLTVRPARPRVRLTVAADAFSLRKGKPLEIEVNIERSEGFADDLTVTAIDLPAGVLVKQAVSRNNGPSSKSVKLILEATASPSRSGPFCIVGIRSGDLPTAFAATASLPKFQTAFTSIWLNVPASPPLRPGGQQRQTKP